MGESRDATLSGHYSELRRCIENSSYQKVVKTANKIIAEDPSELKAWQCKAVAHINQEQFQEALTTTIKSKMTRELAFEKSYCEYRLNKVQAALDSINAAPTLNSQHLQLKAQILYRLERYEECQELYREIIRSTSDEYDMERETNMAAVSVYTSGGDDGAASDGSYELIYNEACRLLARGRLEAALAKLQEAREQCVAFLTQDEATQEEINQEVAIIRVQEGHCMQLMGREKEALAVYNGVLKNRPDDAALLAIINNNLVAINRGGNVFDSRKRMKVATVPGLEHKLTTQQRGAIALNHALLAYFTNQYEVCHEEVRALSRNFRTLALEGQLVEAFLLCKQGQLSEAKQLLNKCGKQFPNQATRISLISTQMLLSKGKLEAACEELGGVRAEDRHRQGIVAARVTLLVNLGQREAASTVLREAVEWHRNHKTSGAQLGELWREAADFHLRSGDPATAAASLLALHRLNPSDVTTLAKLITAYAQYDVAAAQKMAASLPKVTDVAGSLDVAALEATPSHRTHRKAASPRSPGSEPKRVEEQKTKRKKKRKPQLPKNYNPDVLPDPDRWLPRWQRKGYRKRKDRRVKDVMKGTQGVSSDAADKFDITKTAGTYKPAVQPTQSPAAESHPPRRNLHKKKGGGKKKKGGGGGGGW